MNEGEEVMIDGIDKSEKKILELIRKFKEKEVYGKIELNFQKGIINTALFTQHCKI